MKLTHLFSNQELGIERVTVIDSLNLIKLQPWFEFDLISVWFHLIDNFGVGLRLLILAKRWH